jgi:hypothetical protein
MDQAIQLWNWWLALLRPFADSFTRPGWVRFVQWVTGMVLCWEEHTLPQVLMAIGLETRWRVLEHFAEYGTWDRQAVERHTLRLIEQERPARWGPYHPVAIDDTKLHRTSKQVWGTCTLHEPSARSPNRAETVRAHNWVEMGDLVPGRPWTYLPHAARLYYRQSQLPAGETFRTKTALAVEWLRQADAESAAPLLGVFDGAYAVDTVIRPCLEPRPAQRRIEFVTRLRGCPAVPPGGDATTGEGASPQVGAPGRRAAASPLVAGELAAESRVGVRPAAGVPVQTAPVLLGGQRGSDAGPRLGGADGGL